MLLIASLFLSSVALILGVVVLALILSQGSRESTIEYSRISGGDGDEVWSGDTESLVIHDVDSTNELLDSVKACEIASSNSNAVYVSKVNAGVRQLTADDLVDDRRVLLLTLASLIMPPPELLLGTGRSVRLFTIVNTNPTESIELGHNSKWTSHCGDMVIPPLSGKQFMIRIADDEQGELFCV